MSIQFENLNDHDLLIEIATDMRNVKEDILDLKREFQKFNNGIGSPRCADRGARIDALERDVRWSKRMASSGILALAGLAFKFIWDRVTGP